MKIRTTTIGRLAAALFIIHFSFFISAALSRAQPVDLATNLTISGSDDITNNFGTLSNLNFLAGGTLTFTTDITLDGGGANANRLIVAAGNPASFVLDDGVTLTITNNKFAGSGGAINLGGAGASLTLAAGDGAQYIFSGNANTASGNQGGVIYGTTGSVIDITNALFVSNTSNANGGVIFNIGANSITKITNSVFRGNIITGASNDGAAITSGNANPGVWLVINNVLFDSNTTAGGGGAIFVATGGTTAITSSTFVNNRASNAARGGGAIMTNANASNADAFRLYDVTFDRNTTAGAGGAFNTLSNNWGTFTGTNLLFISNSAASTGGAINSGNNNGIFFLTSATFQANTSSTLGGAIAFTGNGNVLTADQILFLNNRVNTGNGGAIGVSGNTGTIAITSATFQGNYASTNGGAISTATTSYILLSDVLFVSNTAGAAGGAISLGTAAGHVISGTLTNVSFLDNYAGTQGGALSIQGDGSTLSLIYTASGTIAGNKAVNRGAGIYINNNNSIKISIDIADGASLDMVDPMYVNLTNNQLHTITKTGAGTWNLGGENTFWPNNATPTVANASITIAEGTLHLYRAGETSGTYAATAANLTLSNDKGGTAALNFFLKQGATLSVGGGNSISTSVTGTISFEPGSNIILDLTGASKGTSLIPPISSVLTLNVTAANLISDWTQNFTLLNVPDSGLSDGDYFNLINLTGGANFGALDPASLNVLGLPDSDPLYHLRITDGAILQLYYGALNNNVIAWLGTDGSSWKGSNWIKTSNFASTSFGAGDIINLTDNPMPPSTTTLNVDTAVVAAGIYVSGNTDFTITGGPIITSATNGTFAGSDAASGKLVLGAQANPDASVDTTAAYAGTLTLSNTTNTFQQGIDIRSGHLVGAAANLAVGASATVTISPAGSLTFDQDVNATYTAPIVGAGNLFKTNTGALTLNADNSGFTGLTTVNEGRLTISASAALGGSVIVNNGIFNSAGTVGGAGTLVSIASTGTLRVGVGTGGNQTFTIGGDLSLADGAVLDYNNGLTNQLHVLGNLSLLGVTTINVTATTPGIWSLIDVDGTGLTDSPANWNLTYSGETLDAPYTLALNGSILQLRFDYGANAVLNWTGTAADGLWESSPVSNWSDFIGPRQFTEGDIVNLTGAAAPTVNSEPETVNLISPVTVAGMFVSGSTSISITGESITADATAGDLAGSTAANGKLTLGKSAASANSVTTAGDATFSGTLDLTQQTGANNFTAGVEINSGVLRVSTTDQLGTTLANLAFTGGTATLDSAPATLRFAADTNITFDSSATGTDHRLTISAGGNGAFVIEDNTTLTFANSTGASTGGAFSITGTGSGLSLIAEGAGSLYLFQSNTTSADAGAIYVTTGGKLILDGSANGSGNGIIFQGNKTNNRGGAILAWTNATLLVNDASFTDNVGGGNGGAVAAMGNSYAQLSNVIFTSNTGAIGGALFLNTSATGSVQSGVFQDNYATNIGGAIGMQNANSTLIASDVTFTGNSAANNGGAISLQTNGRIDITGALFEGNFSISATGQGGAVYLNTGTGTITDSRFIGNSAATGGAIIQLSSNNNLTLTNVSFFDNTATTSGGAIQVQGDNARLAYNVTTGVSSIAGNKAPTGPGIYFNNNNNMTLVVDTDDGATLDMLDPMYFNISNSQTTSATKTGAGLWNLAGSSTFRANAATPTAAVVNFTVAEGTLHLYRAGQTSYNGAPVDAGKIVLGDAKGTLNFTLNDGATLSAGGGNSIIASSITLGDNSTIILDLASAPVGSAILTLDAAKITSNWTLNLNLLNVDSLALNDGDTFDLISLANPAATGLFTSLDSFATVTGLETGFNLQLASGNKILQLSYAEALGDNSVLTWTGANGSLWTAANWAATSTATTFTKGDIINLADSPAIAAGGATTINVNTTFSTTIAGLYVSGTASYTITGTHLTATPYIGTFNGDPAATGKLILGARAATDDDGAATLDTTSPDTAYSGVLTLNNSSNDFLGGIDILSGRLVGSAATLGAGDPGIFIANGASLNFEQPADASYDSPIASADATAIIDKTGPGKLTLNADSSAFQGSTFIYAGALLLGRNDDAAESAAILPATASLGGNITAGSGATFGGSGTATGNVTIATGGFLAPSGTLAISNTLTLQNNSTLLFNPGENSSCDLLSIGQLSRAGALTIDVSSAASGTYTLLSSASALAASDATNLHLTLNNGSFSARTTGTAITLENSDHDLILTLITENIALTWNSGADGAWNASDANWTGSLDDKFVAGDSVTFASGANAIEIAPGGVKMVDMLVTGGTHTFTGGAITVSSTIPSTLAGSGKLNITAGAVTLDNAAAAGAGAAGGNTFDGGIDIAAGASLTGNAATLGNAAILNNGSLTFNQSAADGAFTTPITGAGSLAKTGAASLTLASAAYTGGLTVSEGALTLQNPDTSTQAPITIDAGASLLLTNAPSFTINHPLTGAGALDISLTAPAGIVNFTSAAGTDFAGTLALGASTFTLDAASDAVLANATLQLNDGNTTTVAPGATGPAPIAYAAAAAASAAIQPYSLSALTLNGGRIDFTATVPADDDAAATIQVDTLNLFSGTVAVNLPAAPAQASPGGSLFAQSVGAARATLVEATTVTGNTNFLTLIDKTTGAPVTAQTVAIGAIATGTYSYTLNNALGLHVNYALTGLTINPGETLTLTPAIAENTFAATIGGSGNLEIDASTPGAATVTLTKTNDYTGATTLTAGNLTAGADNALGKTSGLTQADATTFNTGAYAQTIGAIHTAVTATTTIATAGSLTIASGGLIDGVLAGNGALNLDGGTLDITQASRFTGVTTIATAATVNLANAAALGTGIINNAGILNINSAEAGALSNTLTGNGALNINGAGPTTITGASASFTGPVAIAAAADVTAASAAALGAGPVALDGNLTYVAAGSLANNITGPGALTFAGGNMTVSGNNNVASISIQSGANITAASPNALKSDTLEINAASLEIAAAGASLGRVTMTGASRLAFAASLPNGSATLASLTSTGPGPVLAFKTNFEELTSDTLRVATINGPFTINIANTGAAPAATETTLTLIPAPVAGSPVYTLGAVTGVNFADSMYNYEYTLSSDAGGLALNVVRDETLGPVGGAIIANATGILPLTWFAELDSLSLRLGDLHLSPREKPGIDLWTRAHAARLNINNKDTPVAFSEDQYGTEVGLDYGGRGAVNGAYSYVGAFFGYGGSTRELDLDTINGNALSVYGGLYATIITPDGWFVDAIGKYNLFRTRISALADDLGAMRANYNTTAFGASVQFGRRIALGRNWHLTPDAQVALARIAAAEYNTQTASPDTDLIIVHDFTSTRQFRAGFRLSHELKTKSSQTIQYYANFHLARQWTDGGAINVFRADTRAPDKSGPYYSTIQGARVEAGVGVNWLITSSFQVHLDYDAAWARSYQKPYGLSLGATYAW